MISPYWTRYFYTYLDFNDVQNLSPDQIISRHLEQTVAALVNNSFTGLARNYERFVTPGGSRTAAVSAAALEQGKPAAPESLISLFGLNLANNTVAATALPLPESLAGTEVRITDSAGNARVAPLLYVSPGQVNLLVPPDLAPGPATVTVRSPSRDSTVGREAVSAGTLQMNAVAPGLFSANASGRGPAAAYIQRFRDGTSFEPELIFECSAGPGSCTARPIELGPEGDRVVLTLFGTGFRRAGGSATLTMGGSGVTPDFIGDQRQFAGLDQINVTLPRGLAGRGTVDISVSAGGIVSNTVSINVR
jgi:uncharacterized protein (TIGR03437 family)